jgi:hypothetical protein
MPGGPQPSEWIELKTKHLAIDDPRLTAEERQTMWHAAARLEGRLQGSYVPENVRRRQANERLKARRA